MKKIYFLVFVMMLRSVVSIAQTQKNDINLVLSALPLIGKSGDFSGVNALVFKPSLLYYINDRTSIGINFSYASMDKIWVGRVDSHYNSYAMLPSIRNNFISKKKTRIFADLAFGFGTIQYKPDDSRNFNYRHREKSGGISVFSVGLGANYFFNDKFGLEMLLPYIQTKNITSNSVNTIYSGIGPTIGFVYTL